MTRLSRQESQQLTRQRLIEAAEKEIIRLGIYEASIRQICETAGYSLGAFYSNFSNKDELLLEVVELHSKHEFGNLKDIVETSASLDEKIILKKIAEWLHKLQANKILFSLTLEFEVYAKRNSEFKDQYNENKKRWHLELAQALEALFSGQHMTPHIPPMQMAVGLFALWSGFAIEGSIPGVESAEKIIPIFLEAFLSSSK